MGAAADSLLTETQNMEKAGNFFVYTIHNYATSTVLTIIIIIHNLSYSN